MNTGSNIFRRELNDEGDGAILPMGRTQHVRLFLDHLHEPHGRSRWRWSFAQSDVSGEAPSRQAAVALATERIIQLTRDDRGPITSSAFQDMSVTWLEVSVSPATPDCLDLDAIQQITCEVLDQQWSIATDADSGLDQLRLDWPTVAQGQVVLNIPASSLGATLEYCPAATDAYGADLAAWLAQRMGRFITNLDVFTELLRVLAAPPPSDKELRMVAESPCDRSGAEDQGSEHAHVGAPRED